MYDAMVIKEIKSKDVSDAVKARALPAFMRIAKNGEANYLHGSPSLGKAFQWHLTPEGFEFWNELDEAPIKEK